MDGWCVTQEALQDVVSLEELKMHIRVDGDLEDGYLASLTRAAVDFAENFTKRNCEETNDHCTRWFSCRPYSATNTSSTGNPTNHI